MRGVCASGVYAQLSYEYLNKARAVAQGTARHYIDMVVLTNISLVALIICYNDGKLTKLCVCVCVCVNKLLRARIPVK